MNRRELLTSAIAAPVAAALPTVARKVPDVAPSVPPVASVPPQNVVNIIQNFGGELTTEEAQRTIMRIISENRDQIRRGLAR